MKIQFITYIYTFSPSLRLDEKKTLHLKVVTGVVKKNNVSVNIY